METEAAKAPGADLFGATETATLKYNDKSAFKTVCQELGVSVVEGSLFEMHPEDNENCIYMKNIIMDLINIEWVI